MDAQTAPPPADAAISDLATRQHGVVARRQLESLGLGRGAIGHRLRTGRLHPLHRGVYAVGHARVSREGRWTAAVLAAGPGAVLSHRSAAALWALRPTSAVRIDVTVPSRGGRSRPGIAVHRSARLAREETGTCAGIPVTTPARTLLDLAEVLPARALERALDEAEVQRLFDLNALRAVIASNPGRPGGAALARTLDRHHAGTTRTRSDLEELLLGICARAGLPAPRVNAPVGPYEADLLWPEHRLVVEADSRAYHATTRAFEDDRARDAALVAAGLRVVRFTDRQIGDRPQHVAATLRALLGGDR